MLRALDEHSDHFGLSQLRLIVSSGVLWSAGFVARSGPIPLGYYKDEKKTAETFRSYQGRRWSIPGDFCTVEDCRHRFRKLCQVETSHQAL